MNSGVYMMTSEKAIEDFSKSIELSPNRDARAHLRRGIAYAELGDDEKANLLRPRDFLL